jgi:hypothetical protein
MSARRAADREKWRGLIEDYLHSKRALPTWREPEHGFDIDDELLEMLDECPEDPERIAVLELVDPYGGSQALGDDFDDGDAYWARAAERQSNAPDLRVVFRLLDGRAVEFTYPPARPPRRKTAS